MTVKQLKEELSKYPDEMDVFMAEWNTGFEFELLNKVSCEDIGFKESPDGKILARDKAVIFSED